MQLLFCCRMCRSLSNKLVSIALNSSPLPPPAVELATRRPRRSVYSRAQQLPTNIYVSLCVSHTKHAQTLHGNTAAQNKNKHSWQPMLLYYYTLQQQQQQLLAVCIREERAQRNARGRDAFAACAGCSAHCTPHTRMHASLSFSFLFSHPRKHTRALSHESLLKRAGTQWPQEVLTFDWVVRTK